MGSIVAFFTVERVLMLALALWLFNREFSGKKWMIAANITIAVVLSAALVVQIFR